MSKKKVNVRVDWREDTGVVDEVKAHDEVADYEVTQLDNGDIEIRDPDGEGVLLFERKTVSDYANSMTDRDDHLKDQVERLEEATDAPARVLIEGNMDDFGDLKHTNVLPQSLRGFTASLEERNGAKVKFCSNLENLVDYAIRTARKNFEESSTSLRVESAVKKSEPFTKRVYGCVDGVGPEMAGRLYDTYPTLPDALEADVDDLKQIEGVGDSLAERIHTTLRGL